ncbi:class II 3-deoxy-7-phosphoheptulonate synthase [Haliangium sp.]|uniref:class II 3-deoxy-7-phosphoheptulonate synthase n=1 Tax=Haliangium sp. TaxID=2663208 RepID=UPI003D0F26A0
MSSPAHPPSEWTPSSWQQKTATQQAVYPDPELARRVVAEIARLPPLVTSWEVESLKDKLGSAARGEAFLLQGGDCAESFDECDAHTITGKLKVLLQMSLVLTHGARRPVIRVGRIAGQYAKPRSTDTERRGDVTLPSYRGDLVNRSGFTHRDRTPDPELMLRGYERAALTLNFIRSLADGGFADLHHPEYWDLSFVPHSDSSDEYERIVTAIRDAIEFMEAVGEVRLAGLGRVDFYTSHEGLMLFYEQAQTRTVPRQPGWYNLSTHLPWIGMRTAQPEGAHVEYCRGIRNPLGIKIGPGMTAEWLTELLDILHPDDEPGRITLIHRLGAGQVEAKLPALIETVQRTGKTVLWTVDPMHGNTEVTEGGLKTRRFDNILEEVEASFEVHERMGSRLGGVHLELTGDDVTECVGGARGLSEHDLERAYRSQVDPRLNAEQALEMVMLITRHLRGHRSSGSSR